MAQQQSFCIITTHIHQNFSCDAIHFTSFCHLLQGLATFLPMIPIRVFVECILSFWLLDVQRRYFPRTLIGSEK